MSIRRPLFASHLPLLLVACLACGFLRPAMAQDGPPCGTITCETDQICCDWVCVDHYTDRNDCGACGEACLANEFCVAGACEAIGMTPFDGAADLYLPCWNVTEEETLLVVHALERTEVSARFYDDEGALLLQRSLVLHARIGVWTTFADAWEGAVFDLVEDELFLFCPGGDLAADLPATETLSGRPAGGFPPAVELEVFDDTGETPTCWNSTAAPWRAPGSVISRARREAEGGGSVALRPVLDEGGERGEVAWISYIRRRVPDEGTGAGRTRMLVESGYLFSRKD